MEEPETEWKDLEGFTGYRISKGGVILGRTGQPMSYHTAKTGGKLKVILESDDGKTEAQYVARLVAISFLGATGQFFVYQRDRDYANCHVDNLEVTTEMRGFSKWKPAGIPVGRYELDGETLIKTYPSISAAVRSLEDGPSAFLLKAACSDGRELHGSVWKLMAQPSPRLKAPAGVTLPDLPNYIVCRNGKIFGKRHARYVSQTESKYGYMRVNLRRRDGTEKNYAVHRLVCQAYHGPPPDAKSQVNHKDLNKLNNSASNLEWTSPADNMAHFFDSEFSPRKPVICTDKKTGRDLWWYESAEAAALDLKEPCPGHISAVCRGDAGKKTAYGHGWRFAEPGEEADFAEEPEAPEPNANLGRAVVCTTMKGRDLWLYENAVVAAADREEETGIYKDPLNIIAVCEGRQKLSYGRGWRYATSADRSNFE